MTFLDWLAEKGQAHINADPLRAAIVRDAMVAVLSEDPAARSELRARLDRDIHLREVDLLRAAWLREGHRT